MAYHHARSNACHSNAVLSGLAAHTFGCDIAGTSRVGLVDQQQSFTVRKTLGTAASSLSFSLNPGASPAFGQDVVLTLGGDLWWGGTITDVTDVIVGQYVRQSVECVDWRWRMDAGPRITRRLSDLAANVALATVIRDHTDAADGFRPGFVSPSLSRVTVELEDATVTEALEAIAGAAGALILRVRPTKRVDMYSAGFPSPASLTLTNSSRGLAGTLTRRTESGQVRTRTRAVGRAAATTAAVPAGATVIPVDQPGLFRPASGVARVVGAQGPVDVSYAAVSGTDLTGVTGLVVELDAGASVAPVEVSNDAPAQTSLAATLGRSTGIVETTVRVDGDYLVCAAVASADVQSFKAPLVSLGWVEDGPLARFYEAGESVTVTLTAPITESGTYTVQSVDVSPGDVLTSDNPRLLTAVTLRTARRPDLVDLLALRR
jgi:hypothetical protein